jgi:phage shock protein PspC (stress-responsive transcriptional regulator)
MAKYCDKCGESVSPDDLFCNNCGAQLDRSKTWVNAGSPAKTSVTPPSTGQTPHTTRPKRFYRSREDRWITGVCGGLGEYFNIDPVLIRIVFIVTTLFYGLGLLPYIALAIFVKENPNQQLRTPPKGNYGNYP